MLCLKTPSDIVQLSKSLNMLKNDVETLQQLRTPFMTIYLNVRGSCIEESIQFNSDSE